MNLSGGYGACVCGGGGGGSCVYGHVCEWVGGWWLVGAPCSCTHYYHHVYHTTLSVNLMIQLCWSAHVFVCVCVCVFMSVCVCVFLCVVVCCVVEPHDTNLSPTGASVCVLLCFVCGFVLAWSSLNPTNHPYRHRVGVYASRVGVTATGDWPRQCAGLRGSAVKAFLVMTCRSRVLSATKDSLPTAS